MGRWLLVMLVGLSMVGLALPATAAPPPGFPPDPPGQEGGTAPAPPRSSPGAPAELTINDTSVMEGAVAVLTVTASAPATDDITVDFATEDGTALADEDYVETTGTVTIPAGQTKSDIEVATIDDDEAESDETFQVRLSNPSSNATIVEETGAVTILDNDEPDAELSELIIEDVTVDEDNNLRVRVFADPAPSSEITVDWETQDGTALAGEDYIAGSGTVTIGADATVGAIAIGLVRDDVLDDPKTFTVVLSNPSTNATIVKATGVVTIVEGFCGTTEGIPVDESGIQSFNDLICAEPRPDEYIIFDDAVGGEEVLADQTIVAFVTNDAGASDLDMHLFFEPSEAAGGEPALEEAEPVFDSEGNQVGLQLEYTTPTSGRVALSPLPNGADGPEVLYHLEVSFPPST